MEVGESIPKQEHDARQLACGRSKWPGRPTGSAEATAEAAKLRQLAFWPKIRTAEDVSQDLQKLLGGPKAVEKLGLQITVEADTNRLIVRVREDFVADIEKAVTAPSTLCQGAARRIPTGSPRPRTGFTAAAAANLPTGASLTADIAEARLELERAEKDVCPRGAIESQRGNQRERSGVKKYELERAKIRLQRAEAICTWPGGGHQEAARLRNRRACKANRERKSACWSWTWPRPRWCSKVSEAELSQAEEIHKKSPGAVSQPELRKYRAAVERGKIQVQRAAIKLDAAKEAGR